MFIRIVDKFGFLLDFMQDYLNKLTHSIRLQVTYIYALFYLLLDIL